MGTTREPWPKDRVELLKELVRTGMSCTQIGHAMQISPASVAGRIFRLRIKSGDDSLRAGLTVGRIHHPKSVAPLSERVQKSLARLAEWKKRHSFTRNGGAAVKALKSSVKRYNRASEARNIMRNQIVCCGEPKTLLAKWNEYGNQTTDLLWCDCRWLVTENQPPRKTYYCANVIEPNSSYCAAHSKMAHGNASGEGFTKRPGVSPNWMTIRSRRRAA